MTTTNPPKWENECLQEATFRDVDLSKATFDDVNLNHATFQNINLQGATFRDINLSHVQITESCIHGLTIWGYDIGQLIEAEQQRQQATPSQTPASQTPERLPG